jgi:hypothetical protein
LEGFFTVPQLGGDGSISFHATLAGTGVVPSTNDTGIWAGSPSGLQTVIRTGGGAGQGPGLEPGATFFYIEPPAHNPTGTLAIWGAVRRADNSGTQGIWSGNAGRLMPFVLQGDAAPGTEPGTTFTTIGAAPPINPAGQIAFDATLTGSSVDSTNDRGVWVDNQLVARSGPSGPTPGSGSGVVFATFDTPTINAAGSVAFRGTVTGSGITANNDRGIWIADAGGVTEVVREGGHAPADAVGPGVAFFDFPLVPKLSPSGDAAFNATLAGSGITSGVNDESVWVGNSNDLRLIAQTGTDGAAGPGLGPGIVFSDIGSFCTNSRGNVVFSATLEGTSSGSNQGIWVTDDDGNLVLVVRTGELFDVSDGLGTDLRTITSRGFIGSSGGDDGRGVVFNENNELVFTLGFSGGTRGVFVAQVGAVPEPATVLLISVGSLMLLRRSRSRG